MRKIAIGVLVLMFCFAFSVSFVGAAEDPFFEQFKSAPLEEKKEYLSGLIKSAHDFVTGDGEEQLLAEAKRHPFKGIGVDIAQDVPQDDDQSFVIVPAVQFVWKSSPADRAGMQPGDLLTSVNGKPICTVTVKKGSGREKGQDINAEVRKCKNDFVTFVREAKGDHVAVEAVRGGIGMTFHLKKENIGGEISTFISTNINRWRAVFKKHEKPLADLLSEVSSDEVSDADLNDWYLKYDAIGNELIALTSELENFKKTLLISP